MGRRSRGSRARTAFGCQFCAHDRNRWFGHLPQIGQDPNLGRVLIRCPRCGALYENVTVGSDQTRSLSPEEAEARYGPLPD